MRWILPVVTACMLVCVLPGPGGLSAKSVWEACWSRTACVCTRRVAPTASPSKIQPEQLALYWPQPGADRDRSSWAPERGHSGGQTSWDRNRGRLTSIQMSSLLVLLWQWLCLQEASEAGDVETFRNQTVPPIIASISSGTTAVTIIVDIASFFYYVDGDLAERIKSGDCVESYQLMTVGMSAPVIWSICSKCHNQTLRLVQYNQTWIYWILLIYLFLL